MNDLQELLESAWYRQDWLSFVTISEFIEAARQAIEREHRAAVAEAERILKGEA